MFQYVIMRRRIKSKTSEVQPTDEQEVIIGTELKNGDCALINAYAGTGKTTTLELLAKANPKKRILYICFNRETALQAKDRFPDNTDCRTIHSLAFALSGATFRHKLGTPRPLDVMRCLHLTAPHVAVHVIATVERFLHTVDSAIEACHLPPEAELIGISPSKIVDQARKLWLLMQEHKSDVPMSHDGYLKLWAMTAPMLAAYDMIFLDEAQDTNPVSLDVVLRQRFNGRTSLVFVGDTHQSIYRWRHAINAMEQLKQIAVATLPLRHR
jgi:F-box protein, helicase, 18